MMRYELKPFTRPRGDNRRETASSKLIIPELTDGFDPELEAPADGMSPVSFCTDDVPTGTYVLHVSLRAIRDTGPVFLFTGRKVLRDILELKSGENCERDFCLSAAEILPRYHEKIYPVTRLFFTFCVGCRDDLIVEECHARRSESIRTIFLCGDSTVTDQSAEIPYLPGACYASWGQALPAYLEGSFAVENQAHCGLTTETFRSEGHFGIVKKYIRSGDLCLFQFGHNDQKLPHLLADRDYPMNLRHFIEEIREKAGRPVLVTPLGRNIWDNSGQYLDLLAEHAQAVRQTAQEMSVPLIDLHEYSVRFLSDHGMEASCGYFHPGDYTHTNEYGAYLFAAFIASELKRLFADEPIKLRPAVDFQTPLHLWDSLDQKNNRTVVAGQREQFDCMEKSTGALLAAIKSAKGER